MAAFISTFTALTRMYSLPCILMLYLFTIKSSCRGVYAGCIVGCRRSGESSKDKRKKRRKWGEADNGWLNMTPWWFGWVLFKRQEKAHKDTRVDSLELRQTCVFVKLVLYTGSYMSLYSYYPYTRTGSLHATWPHCERQINRERMRVVLWNRQVSLFGNLIP